MKGLSLPSVLGALLVGVLAWLFLADDPPAADRGGDARDPGAPDFRVAGLQATAPRNTALSDGNRADSRATRWPLGERQHRSRLPGAPRRVTVRGRCIEHRHGAPLAGVAVDLAVVLPRFGRRVAGETPVTEAPRLHSDGDGRFETVLEVPTHHQVRVRTSMPGRASMQGYPRPGTGHTLDTGDIRIPFGARLSAMVVDQRGRCQPDVAFRVHQVAEEGKEQDTVTPLRWLEARSDSSGQIRTGVALEAGRWTLEPRGGCRLIEPSAGLVVPAGVSSLETRIVITRPDPKTRITGRLCDTRRCPLPGVTVHAVAGGPSLGYGLTDANGGFQIERDAESNDPVQLVVPRAAGFESLTTRETYPWGSTNVILTLARAAELKITVVAEDDGSPVEDFGMAWFWRDLQGRWSRGGRQWPTRHAGGAAVLPAVPAGRVRVVVLPRSTTFAPNEPVDFSKPPAPAELRIALPRRLALPVVVVDGARRPVANTRLQLVRSLEGGAVPLQADGIDHGQSRQAANRDSQVLLLDTTETDARGRATLRWHPRDGALAIRVLGPGHVPTVHAPVFLRPNPEPVQVVVARGATLRGTVAPLDVLNSPVRPLGKRRTWTRQLGLELSYRGMPRSGRFPAMTAPISRDGDFLIKGLAPGTWEVTLRIWRLGGRDGGILRQKCPPITVAAGEHRHLALDISGLRPASLDGRLPIRGAPQVDARPGQRLEPPACR